jgi:hypothetical protein
MPTTDMFEEAMTTEGLCAYLDRSHSYVSALKKAMGIKGSHRIFASTVKAFFKRNPGWKMPSSKQGSPQAPRSSRRGRTPAIVGKPGEQSN